MKRLAFLTLAAASLWFLTTLPLTVLAVIAVAVGAFALGLMCGWLGADEHRRQQEEKRIARVQLLKATPPRLDSAAFEASLAECRRLTDAFVESLKTRGKAPSADPGKGN